MESAAIALLRTVEDIPETDQSPENNREPDREHHMVFPIVLMGLHPVLSRALIAVGNPL
jgi:hypothetical protein